MIEGLVTLQRELASTRADLKLVERENLHFTVRFLGEITDSQATDAAARLRSLELRGAEVTVKGVGAFPRPARPTVIWVGLDKADEARVSPIAASVIRALEGIGQRDDRPFVAHVTLARVRSERNVAALADLLRTNSERVFGKVRLTTIKLVSSLLTPRGAVYTDLEVFPLG